MIKTLAKSLREHKKGSVITMILSILEVVFEIVIPLYMSDLIDFGIEQGSLDNVFKYGFALILFAVMELLTGVLSAKFAAKASAGLSANLRQDMYDNVQRFSFSNIDKFSSASIVTRLTTDVTNIQNAWQMIIRMAIRGPVMMLFAMVVSFSISHDISMIFLVLIPVLAVLLFFIMKCVSPYFKRVFMTYDQLNSVVEEDVKGIRVVKSCNREDYEIKKFDGISESIYKDFSKGERLLALNSPLMQLCMYGVMILVSWIGAKAIVASGNNIAFGLTTGQLTALLSYAQQILMSLMMLSMVLTMITMSASSGNRIAEILNEKPDITDPQDPVTEMKDGSIRFENVDFVYSTKADKKVLNNIALFKISADLSPEYQILYSRNDIHHYHIGKR